MKWKSVVNMTFENHHGYGLVALQQQRQMSVVDDDQRLGFCCVAPPSCLKVYGGGGLLDFSVSPRALGSLSLLELGWGWAKGV